jgi:hypothetical protein
LEAKKKKMFGHEKNQDYLSKIYGHFIRRVALDYFKKRSLESLKQQFLDHGEDGLMSPQIDIFCKSIKALPSSKLSNNYNRDYWKHGSSWTSK